MRPTTSHGDWMFRTLLPAAARTAAIGASSWTFVYTFFTNHLPFLAPNRSEPCSAR